MTEKKSNVVKSEEQAEYTGEISPFQDEFDPASVVNKNVIEKELAEKSNIIKKPAAVKKDKKSLDKILSADEDELRQNSFKPGLGTEDIENSDELELKKKLFKDFLIAPKITGKTTNIPHSNRIPGEIIQNRGRKIEINDDPNVNDDEHNRTTILVNKNVEGEIESIEVYCQCGERTMIKLNYDDEEE